jgi:hypothetical protein
MFAGNVKTQDLTLIAHTPALSLLLYSESRACEIPQLRCCGLPPSAELKSIVAGATVRVTVTFALPLLFL